VRPGRPLPLPPPGARFLRWRPDRDPASCSIHQLD
jgi:hypothetical protein